MPGACGPRAGRQLARRQLSLLLSAESPTAALSHVPACLSTHSMSFALNVELFQIQMDAMFAIAPQKAKLGLQAAITKIHHDEGKSLVKIGAICV